MKRTLLTLLALTLPALTSAQTLTADKPSYAVGDAITITFTGAPGNSHDYIGVLQSGAADPKSWPDTILDWKYTSGTQAPSTTKITSGAVTFTSKLPSGAYDVRFYPNDALTSTTRITVYVGIAAPTRVQVNGTGTLKWNQDAPDLASASSYVYVAHVEVIDSILTATCFGSTTPFACSARLPNYPVGDHSLTLTAANTAGASLPSSPLLFSVVLMVPNTPTGLLIIQLNFESVSYS